MEVMPEVMQEVMLEDMQMQKSVRTIEEKFRTEYPLAGGYDGGHA